MKYIDADKLIAEIEKILAKAKNDEVKAFAKKDAAGHLISVTKTAICVRIKKLIASLQQEMEFPEKYQTPDWLFEEQKKPEVDLDKLVSEEFASHSRSTEYGLEVTYNRAELYQLIKKMALVFNARKEDEKGILAEVMQLAGFKPPYLDGNQYCTLFGIDLMRSFVGFGNTETESFVEALKDVKKFIEK